MSTVIDTLKNSNISDIANNTDINQVEMALNQLKNNPNSSSLQSLEQVRSNLKRLDTTNHSTMEYVNNKMKNYYGFIIFLIYV